MARAKPSCHDKALELLGRRSHFRRELEAKLRQRRYEEDEIRRALGDLERRGLLDDLETARELTRGRLARGAVGSRRLLADLRRRGAPDRVAEQAVRELAPRDELPMARRAAARWMRASSRRDPSALARHLDRRGFPPAVIVEVVRHWESATEEDPVSGEGDGR